MIMSKQRLLRQIALVTGASRGIGRGIALRLAREGCDLAITATSQEAMVVTKAEVEALGCRCLTIACDVAVRAAVFAMVERVAGEFGMIDILVNNAGIHQIKHILQITEEDLDRTMAINVKGVFFCMQAIAPHMMKAGYGKIINIASHGGKRPTPNTAHYGASKAAVISLTKSWALALAPHRINVNAVCPGAVETDMYTRLAEETEALEGLPSGEFMKRMPARIPLGRAGTPEDVAGLVSFLASSDSDYMTGQAINVSGGVTMF
jgi:meso-butanediol dehydrogenase / (S,S)-butanediol dehydrogenase / diacetyl reductase